MIYHIIKGLNDLWKYWLPPPDAVFSWQSSNTFGNASSSVTTLMACFLLATFRRLMSPQVFYNLSQKCQGAIISINKEKIVSTLKKFLPYISIYFIQFKLPFNNLGRVFVPHSGVHWTEPLTKSQDSLHNSQVESCF